MGTNHSEFFAELEAKGEAEVRIALAKGLFQAGQKTNLAQEWLSSKDRDRSESACLKRDSREEETLRIAKEANSFAKEANRIASEDLAAALASAAASERAASAAERQARWAIWAAVVATIAAIVAASTQINELISWLQK